MQSLIIAFAMYSKIPMPRADWNDKNMRYLGASQAPNGSWLSDHSAAYSTSAALLSLALNYRFLPIYEQ